ncbi:MAG TPA: hypothetical protein V6D31_05560 [Candidatus Sericytochromatia bacterium]
MLKLKKITQILTSIALTSIFPYSFNQSAIAGTSPNREIRINYVQIEETLVAEALNGYLEVPDKNTTVSAYGGKMRLYDVHVGRMIALSHHFHCKKPYIGQIEKVMGWEYRAWNGKINMGTFNLNCNLVKQAVSAYGLGKAVPMDILRDGRVKTINIPTLDIQGEAETADFLRFVQTLKPQR